MNQTIWLLKSRWKFENWEIFREAWNFRDIYGDIQEIYLVTLLCSGDGVSTGMAGLLTHRKSQYNSRQEIRSWPTHLHQLDRIYLWKKWLGKNVSTKMKYQVLLGTWRNLEDFYWCKFCIICPRKNIFLDKSNQITTQLWVNLRGFFCFCKACQNTDRTFIWAN